MVNRKTLLWSAFGVVLLVSLAFCAYQAANLWWSEWKGPYHNTTSVADLDEDGDLDVVLTNVRKENELIYWSNITLWINQGGGKFTPESFETPPLPFYSTGAADMDGDGDYDILALTSDSVMLFRNHGGAQNGEAGIFTVGYSGIRPDGDTGTPGSVILGDLNNDGALDGFVAGCCGMYLHEDHPGGDVVIHPVSWVWLNPWDPRDMQVSEAGRLDELNGLRMRAAALGDLNNDGSLDVYAAMLSPQNDIPQGAADRILLNNGSGGFVDSGQRLGGSESTAAALADLEGDGDLDALVGTLRGAEIWVNQGGVQGGQAGEFLNSGQEIAGSPTNAVFLEDLDGDGDQDALIGGIKQAVIWWNDGEGIFKRSNCRFLYSERHGLALGDFNSDGLPDIFAGAYANRYRVWINQQAGIFR